MPKKGFKNSEETKKRISNSKKGKPNLKLRGTHWSEEHKKLWLDSRVKNDSFKHTEEWKINHGEKMMNKNNPNWQGGKSLELYPQDWNETLKQSIRERDGYLCQLCGVHQEELIGRFEKLDIHHIDYSKINCNPDNLVTLCRECHIKTNFNREYWIDLFKNLCRK